MGLSKTEVFSARENRIAELARAFAHPARVAIVEYLIANQECICNDLVEALPLSQSTISQHLKALKEIGIIQGTIERPRICYCLDQKTWKEATGLLQSLLEKGNLSCC